jgi:hypothetical protein
VGLDAETGKVRWVQPKIKINNGAVLAARIAGVPVFVTQRGFVVRARDGAILDDSLEQPTGDIGWAPPVILGDVVYLPRYGVNQFNVLDYTGAKGDEWEAKHERIDVAPPLAPVGKRVDRWTAGSPLVADGVAYQIDIYGTLYVVDLKAKKMLYAKDTGLRGVFHYNSLPVAASPTLVGKHVIVQDNQGTALVLEAGREYKEIARNHLGTQLDRYWPIPAQETIGYSPPIADGDRLYIRGERFLYCIGEK